MPFIKAFSAHPDVVICFLLAVVIGIIVYKMVPALVDKYYAIKYKNNGEHTGENATKDTVKAKSIDDMFLADKFAIVVKDEEKWQYDASACIDDIDTAKMYNIKLVSGEHVAVRTANNYAKMIDSVYLLPIGRIIKCDMQEDKEVLSELEEYDKLDRYDFYIDARIDIYAKDSVFRRDCVKEWLSPVAGFIAICLLWPLLYIFYSNF